MATANASLSNFDLDSTLTWDGIHEAIQALGLTQNVFELERDGITTLTPEQSGVTPEFVETVRNEMLRLGTAITERQYTLESGPDQPMPDLEPMNSFMVPQLLAYKIPAFEELFFNPATQALHGYLLGPERRLSTNAGFLKWQSSDASRVDRFEPFFLHTDSPTPDIAPVPLTPLMRSNTNFVLTDIRDWEDGPMVVAKGSHREGRNPQEIDAKRMEGYFAPAGSIVIFGSGLQHGSLLRLKPGMRITINTTFCQPYITPQEHIQGQFPELAARGKLAAQLMWKNAPTGWGIHGPAYLPTPFTKRTRPEGGYGLLSKERHPNGEL